VAEALVALLEKAQSGDRIARDALYKLAFYRLRTIASCLLRRERPGHTLQPTALISELFLKLQRREIEILNEDHFFRMSARAMRQVLIDHARVRKSVERVPLERIPELLLPADAGAANPELRLSVRQAFERLKAMDALVAETVWLRTVEGISAHELSRMQGRAEWRVRADYDFGLQWMAGRLKRCPSGGAAAGNLPAGSLPL
jgi:RNA polymerase sigma factor (TIGR02999 family)